MNPPDEIPATAVFVLSTLYAPRLARLRTARCCASAAVPAGTALREAAPAPTTATTVHSVAPLQTDPAISTAFEPHIAVAPAHAFVPRLVVFLPGTNGTPAAYSKILDVAGSAGAHAIGLMYPDTLAI